MDLLAELPLKLQKNVLAFTGTLEQHPDKKAILSFLVERNVDPVYITDYPAFDIGGVLPIMEK